MRIHVSSLNDKHADIGLIGVFETVCRLHGQGIHSLGKGKPSENRSILTGKT
jgi:hypothetical protein